MTSITFAPRPLHIPPLPARPNNAAWPNAVTKAYDIISSAYDGSSQLLRLEDGDPIRLRQHSERLTHRVLPVLKALTVELQDKRWTFVSMAAFDSLVSELNYAATTLDQVMQDDLTKGKFTTTVKIGKPGRPPINIDPEVLREATSSNRKITLTQLARSLDIHRHTLRKEIKRLNLPALSSYAAITDDNLDELIRAYKQIKPNSGTRYVMGYLSQCGFRVQRQHVRDSLRRIDALGQILRNHAAIDRRVYVVPYANYLWHIDGHHKLIRWGIVIHGGADGFDRLMLMLRASTNNLADTVLDVFLEAVKTYGAPSRVRGDRGGENVEVAIWMIKHRGPNRASFMWGSSTRNTRIERMWVEVGTQFAMRWRAFFTRLERFHRLVPDQDGQLWLLHILFLNEINADCEAFRHDWNHHPISGKAKNQTPLDMQFISQLEKGVISGTDFNDVHPEVLARYYGVNGPERRRRQGQTGAGHYDLDDDNTSDSSESSNDSESDSDSNSESKSDTSGSNSDSDSDGLNGHLAADQERHIRHPPIPVPSANSPFANGQFEALFRESLSEVQKRNIVPDGYGVTAAEWQGGLYGDAEEIALGRSGRKVSVALPRELWWRRAIRWAQGLEVLTQILMMQEDDT
ncbi:hypothetical protein VTO73DRAFT_10683 [Trametes versicolor]